MSYLPFNILDIYAQTKINTGRSVHTVNRGEKFTRCDNGSCEGMVEGEQCNNITDCNPGLYCTLESTCQKILPFGAECSYDD